MEREITQENCLTIPRRPTDKANLAYSARIEDMADITAFAQILCEYLNCAYREQKDLVCEVWLEHQSS